MATPEVMWWDDNQCKVVNDTFLAVDDYTCCAAGLSTPVTPREIGYFFLSLLVLCYIFLGVALGADVFMTSIETITSKEKAVKVTVNGEKKIFHTQVSSSTPTKCHTPCGRLASHP